MKDGGKSDFRDQGYSFPGHDVGQVYTGAGAVGKVTSLPSPALHTMPKVSRERLLQFPGQLKLPESRIQALP